MRSNMISQNYTASSFETHQHSFNLLQNYYFPFGSNLKIEPELPKCN